MKVIITFEDDEHTRSYSIGIVKFLEYLNKPTTEDEIKVAVQKIMSLGKAKTQ